AAVVAAGPMLDAVLEATHGLDVTVLYATTIRPFDAATLRETVVEPEVVLVEPYLAGTSSSEVARVLIDRRHRVLALGVTDTELRRYGTPADHERAHALEAAERLRAAPVPDEIADAALKAYAGLGSGRVAVRSSATAEDLPGASFAGQQDTYLDVSGDVDLLDAIRRCWASLWNERAVAYRRANSVDDRNVSLAVVVQEMVDASAAGVLFTADPVTGRRRRASIDAVAGLGEKLVSGAVDPDHYAVDVTSRRVVQRPEAGKSSILSEQHLLALAELGDRVERHFNAPQDIEFALDREHNVLLVQSRPITTLYPLPKDAPDPEQDLRVYFSGSVFQGYFEPFTPMGIQFFRLLSGALSGLFGFPVKDAVSGAGIFKDPGMRLYLDVTPIVRDPVGRRIFLTVT